MEELTMLKSRYLTGILVLLSLTAGSAVASAATKTMPDSSTAQTAQVVQAAAHHNGPHRPFYEYRGLYDYAGPRAGYDLNPWYDGRWDSNTWSTGNGYY